MWAMGHDRDSRLKQSRFSSGGFDTGGAKGGGAAGRSTNSVLLAASPLSTRLTNNLTRVVLTVAEDVRLSWRSEFKAWVVTT